MTAASRSSGLTLLELMIVVAIIGILVALLLPAAFVFVFLQAAPLVAPFVYTVF